jgi:hypothetical protein
LPFIPENIRIVAGERKSKKVIPALVIIAIIVMLVLVGPASAISLHVSTDKGSYAPADDVVFTVGVDITENGERVPVQNVTLTVSGGTNTSKTCVFYPNGTKISGCDHMTISRTVTSSSSYGYGYMFGYGYGYNPPSGSYGTANRTFDYGYGYGYDSGYDWSGGDSELLYTITWDADTDEAGYGSYTARLSAFAQQGSTSRIYKSATATAFTILRSNGVACTADSQCESTHCVSGYCCSSECIGTCCRCDVSGSEGTCTDVTSRCDGTASSCYCSGGSCVACGSGYTCSNYACIASGTGGSEGVGSTGGADGGAVAREAEEGHEANYPPEETTAEEFESLIEGNADLLDALEEALGVESLTEDQIEEIAEISAEVARNSRIAAVVEHTDGAGSRIEVTVEYTGEADIEGAVLVYTVPKSFASSSSDVTVITEPPGATIVVVRSDPVFSIKFESVETGKILKVFFETARRVNRDTVRSEMEKPRFFGLDFKEEAPALLPAVCGNGVKEKGEECDGEDGVPEGYGCTDECLLRKLQEPPLEEGPPVEEAHMTIDMMLTSVLMALVVAFLVLGVWYYAAARRKRREEKMLEGEEEEGDELLAPPPSS